jgi:2-phosphoglycerate kinase
MLPVIENALVVQCVIAIESEETHAGHFWIRDLASDGMRPLDKYLEKLSDIRYLQDYVLERARSHDVPVIDNRQREASIAAVMELVLTAADRLQKVS